MEKLRVYGDLVKYRLSLAVTFSAVTGYLIREPYPGTSIILLISGVFLLASGSAAMNQYSERDNDAMMQRTMSRPIPARRLSSGSAILISSALLLAGFFILLAAGGVPATLGAFTVLLYNIVYTALKKISWFAVIPGAMVGAIPPFIGFTAAGGLVPDADIILFSVFMFMWQLPHFWLILLKYRNEYRNAGFKTLPGDMKDMQVRMLVFLWVLVTSFLLAGFSISDLVFSRVFSVILIPLNIGFIMLFHSFLFRKDECEAARGSFILINTFSLIIMILFIANSFSG